MATYRLHYFPESGNSYKLALMLTLCEQSFDLVWTDFGAGVTRTPEWRATVNAMGEIPVLEVDGEKLTQTGVILRRLADCYGRFGEEAGQCRDEILRWLFWDNQKLSGHLATYRFMRTFTATPDPQVLKHYLWRIRDFLGILDWRFGQTAFVVGEKPTIADISMIAYLSYPADETGFDLSTTHPNVQAWLDRVAALPGWRAPYDLLPGERLVHYA